MTNGPAGPAGTIGTPPGNRSPGLPAGLIDPISGTLGTLEYDHNEGISITGGFVYRGTAMPELYGKYIFGDLALIATPVRANGRIFYADLQTGHDQCVSVGPVWRQAILPNGLTVHGFGQDAAGEIYALVTNTLGQWEWRARLQARPAAAGVLKKRQPVGHLLAHHRRAPGNADQQLGRWPWQQLGHRARFVSHQSCNRCDWPGQRQRVLPAVRAVKRMTGDR